MEHVKENTIFFRQPAFRIIVQIWNQIQQHLHLLQQDM